ncbi:MAG: hypothetical protein IJ315_04225 [Firmicutes bacterium]|nr:hypothetical protein [Bacillota bacterium]
MRYLLTDWLESYKIIDAIDEWRPKQIEAFLSVLEKASRQELLDHEDELCEVLMKLLECQNVDYVRRMLDLFPEWMGNGFLPQDEDNLLSFCIMRQNILMLKFLLMYGVDPNQQDWEKDGLTTAIQYENFEAVLALLNHGATVNYCHFELVNEKRNGKILEQLLLKQKRCIDLSLIDAVRRDWSQGVEIYLAYNADVNFEGFEGLQPLDYAESDEMRKLLRSHGAKRNRRREEAQEEEIIAKLENYEDEIGNAIRWASRGDESEFLLELAERGRFRLLRFILSKLEDKSVIDREMYSAVVRPGKEEYKSWADRLQLIRELDKMGIQLSYDPIYAACMNKEEPRSSQEKIAAIEVLEFFRMRGCKMDDYYADGLADTALGCAVMCQNELCMNWLLKNGVQVRAIGEESYLHLLLFVDELQPEKAQRIAKKLMAMGMDPEVTDYAGNTVLHDICEFLSAKKLADRIEIALACGVDPQEKNNAGKTAYIIGKEREDIPEEVLKALL